MTLFAVIQIMLLPLVRDSSAPRSRFRLRDGSAFPSGTRLQNHVERSIGSTSDMGEASIIQALP